MGADLHKLHTKEVRARIMRALEDGAPGFHDVLARVDGADPRLVDTILKDIEKDGGPAIRDRSKRLSVIRSDLLDRLPASDPALGQWWYTPDTQELLAQRILDIGSGIQGFRVLCLGAPTVAPLLVEADCHVDVAEVDPDTIEALREVSPRVNVLKRDLMRRELKTRQAHLAIVDPPWYREEMRAFLRAALRNVSLKGYLMVSLPPLLTRPGVAEEREELVSTLRKYGAEVLFLERNIVKYVVPRFEESAFGDVAGFCGQPWRVADLMVCVKRREDRWRAPTRRPGAITVGRYYQNAQEFRVFVGKSDAKAERAVITRLPDFSSNVSRRAHKGMFPNVWTSEKIGALVQDIDEAKAVLEIWQRGLSRKDAAKRLEKTRGLKRGVGETIIEQYDSVLQIWSKFRTGIGRRLPAQIRKAKAAAMTKWATAASRREHSGSSDGFRLEFPRDRDRIQWSGSFRKLAGKTQLFPVETGDQLRQRLAHSVEVMQLAGTIADSFGLDRDLVEAGALAHDIGHTPFGHAGEHALDSLITDITGANTPGFNHYEHGVDVVRYLEGPYQSSGRTGHMGLNLTPEVCDCIFKHTYCQSGPGVSHDEIWKQSKHARFLGRGYCHLEGQAVRIADKVSYLISDLEDGIRLDAIDDLGLMSCRLFHRPPIDLGQPRGEPLIRRFLMQRRNLIKILMEDIITETGRRLIRLSGPKDVRNQDSYVVDHSDALKADVDEVWKKLQVARLHTDPRVIRANMKAAKIVSELFLLVAIFPELVPDRFRREHQALWKGPYLGFYRRKLAHNVGLPPKLIGFLPLDRYIGFSEQKRNSVAVESFVMAKDYVASLTDDQARALHAENLG